MLKILVVDDDELLRYYFSEGLKRSNFTVLQAKNGEEAVEILDNFQVEFMFLDINMPIMDGFEVAKHVLKMGYDVKTVMMTANASLESIDVIADIGVEDLMVKPFTIKDMLDMIEKIMIKSDK